MARCFVIILIIALVALGFAVGMAALLFVAGISERRQRRELADDITSERKAA